MEEEQNLTQEITSEDSFDKSSFFKKIIKKKKLILLGFFLLLLLFIPVLIISLSNKSAKNTDPEEKVTPKTWEIIVSYNLPSDKLSLKKLTLLNRQISPDYRGAKFSRYQINLKNEGDDILYKSKIPVTEQFIYNILNEPVSTESGNIPIPNPSDYESIIYIPFFESGKKITITRDDVLMLELSVPTGKTSGKFNLINQAYSQTCSPLVAVFVSDNYTDFNQFHSDVEKFKQAFLSTQPYASKNPGIFDFKTINNTQDLGCKIGLIQCIGKTAEISQIVNSKFPNASKAIVIANAPEKNPNDGGVLGVASGIGGNVGVFPNNFGNVTSRTLTVARHEFLGHMVGLLYDRYVMTDVRYGNLQGGIKSNCTDNPGGESFWTAAGASQAYQGCGNNNQYGSSPLTCPSGNPKLLSGGNSSTLMSAVGCGGPSFDVVDTAWIRDQVLPDYTGCSTGDTPAISPPPDTGGGTSGGGAVSSSIEGSAFNDVNNNNVKDAGEGISGVSVSLSGKASKSATTDGNGNYSFDPLVPGDYEVSFAYSGTSKTNSVSLPENTTYKLNFIIRQSGSNTGLNPSPTPISFASQGWAMKITPICEGVSPQIKIDYEIPPGKKGYLITWLSSTGFLKDISSTFEGKGGYIAKGNRAGSGLEKNTSYGVELAEGTAEGGGTVILSGKVITSNCFEAPTPTSDPGFGGGSGITSTPTPTPMPYNCRPDPSCASNKKNLQLCTLICTPL